jgi:signal transduction histidine kinase
VTGRTGDIIQFGTMIPFVPFFAIMTISLTNLLKKLVRYGIKSEAAWQILSLGSFTSMALNDALTVTGLVESPMVLSIGIVGSSAFIGLDLNRKILSIYSEIEYLRANLEVEVERKTLELKAAQAEMISNAKMASLGTLSAGIAHEINNSLNYVRGSLAPLTKIIKAAVDFDGKTKALGLLQVMEEGLTVTFAIMTSLRTYSGLNHAKVKEYVLTDLVKSILNILRSKIPEFITIELAIPDDLRVEVNGAGLNQVLMNLIVNGIDAIQSKNTTQESPGKICISASPDGDGGVRIYVKDTGPGIPTDIIGKIFDPFFTTKDVGKGTGLGLHICRAEVARHKGTLTVKSEVGAGAEFIIHIPRHHGSDSLGAMAA